MSELLGEVTCSLVSAAEGNFQIFVLEEQKSSYAYKMHHGHVISMRTHHRVQSGSGSDHQLQLRCGKGYSTPGLLPQT